MSLPLRRLGRFLDKNPVLTAAWIGVHPAVLADLKRHEPAGTDGGPR